MHTISKFNISYASNKYLDIHKNVHIHIIYAKVKTRNQSKPMSYFLCIYRSITLLSDNGTDEQAHKENKKITLCLCVNYNNVLTH